jgi:FtsP/CotA-like multicopper oxidase with cupredoxin domain
MDGVPHLTQHAVEPGGSFDYSFPVPDAGTFWYHPHERSYEQVARGLFGTLIVAEREPPAADQDLVLVLNDWRLTGDGTFHEASLGSTHDRSHAGRLGNVITVNGKDAFAATVKRFERLRLRLLNASSARVLKLNVEGAVARLIAFDGQPVPPTSSYGGEVELGPGNRADLMLDVIGEPGSSIRILEVSKAPLALGTLAVTQVIAGRSEPLIAQIALAPNPVPEPDPKDALSVDLVMEGGAASEMDLSINTKDGPLWTFNGVGGMTERPLFAVPRGRSVIVRMVNRTAWPHTMHYHGHHFRVLSRSGGQPVPRWWWDTVLMQPREEVTIAFLADNPGKWMIHCHMLDHQAAGMDTWFEVGA